MADLGQAYVQIIPTAQGISGKIEEVLSPEASSAGKSAGKTISKTIGSSLASSGKKLALGVTAPIAAIGTASVAAYKEMHSGLETIIQKTGASGEALESMQTIMGNLLTDMPTDFDTAGAAIGEVNTRFGLTGDALEALSAQFIKFADLNGTDVSNSIDKVQSAMAAFGLGAEDAGAFLDTLNKVGQDTGVSVDQLAGDLMNNAAMMDQLGYSASDAANFIGNLNKNGIDSSSVMAGLKKAYTNAAKNGKTMGEALSDLQSAFADGAEGTEAYQEAVDLFGSKAGPAIAKAVAEGRLSFDELGTSIEDNLGNIDNTFNETLTPMDEFQTAMNSIKVTGAQVGATLMTTIAPIITKISNGIKILADKWAALSPEAQNTIVKILLISAAVAPVLGIASKVIGVITTIGSVLAALASGPALGIIAIIGTIGAAVAFCITHWEDLKTVVVNVGTAIMGAVQTAWGVVSSVIGGAVSGVAAFIAPIWDGIYSTATTAWDTIKSAAQTAWDAIGTFISDPIGTAKDGINTLLEPWGTDLDTIWTGIQEGVSTAWDNISGAISIDSAKTAVGTAVGMISGALSTTWTTISDAATNAWDGISTAISDPVGTAKSAIDTCLEPWGTDFDAVWTTISDAASTAWTDIGTFISDPIGTAKDGINTLLEPWGTDLDTIWTGIKDATSAAWTNISGAISVDGATTAVGTTVGFITGALSSAWTGIQDAATTAWDGISTAISDPVGTAKSAIDTCLEPWGTDFDTVWTSISDAVSAAWTSIGTFISDPIGTAKDTIAGAINLISTGFSTTWTSISEAASTAWDAIGTFISDPIGTAQTTLATAVSTIKTGLSTTWTAIKTTATTAWTKIKTAITSPITTAKNTVKSIIDKIKGFFSFEITWPHIPMPHFSISPAGWKIGDLLKGSIPTLGITWEAKAKDEPYMFTGATLFGAGEAGDEMLYGRESLMRDIREAAGGSNSINNTFYITVDGTENPEEFADKLVRRLKLNMRTA